MGGNPRYRLWSRDNWRGYAPTIGDMLDWRIVACCSVCGLKVEVDPAKVIRRKGRNWSPWDQTSPCIRLNCHGRMRWQAANGRTDFDLWL